MDIKFINRATKELVTERPPGEDILRFLYGNPVGEALVLPIAKQKFISDWYGKKMDSPSSVSRIEPFIRSLNIDMSESEKQINEFTSFNDFFYRKLKSGTRKIEAGLVSPGDGKILVFKKVSEVKSFFVKGEKFTLGEFLEDEKLAEEYQDAAMVILRLAPNDYHRYHFPYQGIPSACHEIGKDYYSVSPISLEKKFTQVFTKNKREICRLKTAGKGDILIIPVGATMVGSLNSTFTPESPIEKGEEMGYFAFGGSTIVLLFDANSFELDSDLVENTQNHLETAVRMGEKIAIDKI